MPRLLQQSSTKEAHGALPSSYSGKGRREREKLSTKIFAGSSRSVALANPVSEWPIQFSVLRTPMPKRQQGAHKAPVYAGASPAEQRARSRYNLSPAVKRQKKEDPEVNLGRVHLVAPCGQRL